MRRPGAAAGRLGLLAAALLWCSGCSAIDDGRPDDQSAGEGPHVEIQGPWAAEFEHALASGTSPAESTILADGEVTALELEQAHDGVRRCLADSGLTIDYEADGGFELGASDGRPTSDRFDRADAALQACEAEHDRHVTFLFEQTRRNPEKLDDATVVAACLVDAGLVGPGYGRADYEADGASGAWSFKADSREGRQCLLDPLGVWRQP